VSRLARALAAALLAFAPLSARADAWDPGEVAEAEKLRAGEAARAALYRERVARGEVRAASAPMPREAPQRPDSAGAALRDAADVVDFIERLFGRGRDAPEREARREERERERERRRDELRRLERERRDPAADWWEEEERRLRGEE
jgi:hypothetical protein